MCYPRRPRERQRRSGASFPAPIIGLASCVKHSPARGIGRILKVAGKCDVCGKTTKFGRNVSFSKRRTNRMFKPNVQSKVLVIDGERRRMKVCTNCLRTMVKSV
jgi:large subunit ribosomal protein L28